MDAEIFIDKLNELASHFGKDIKDGQVKEWVKQFSWMDERQWDMIAAGARENLEHFPSGAYIYAQLRERKFARRVGPAKTMLISVECPGKSVVRGKEGKEKYQYQCKKPQCHALFISSDQNAVCPTCGEKKLLLIGPYVRYCRSTFVVTEVECRVAIENRQVFHCPNHQHFDCPVTFDPKVILEKNRDGVIYAEQFTTSEISTVPGD
jgi:hypothetical protein